MIQLGKKLAIHAVGHPALIIFVRDECLTWVLFDAHEVDTDFMLSTRYGAKATQPTIKCAWKPLKRGMIH